MAAGLGFKDFTTGEVLTAADVDGYLMQGIWVFASAAARDAAVTSPQEGNFAFLKDTNTTTYYTGSAWTNLDTTGMVNPMTTTGDTIYSSSGSTPARLGIGTAGQVLQVNSGATAPEWATPAAGGMTLISTTSLSGTTVTLSSIPQTYNNLYVLIQNFFSNTPNRKMVIKPNASSSLANYTYNSYTSSTSNSGFTAADLTTINVAESTDVTRNNFILNIYKYTDTVYGKVFDFFGSQQDSGLSFNAAGTFGTATAISSLQFTLNGSGNFDGGQVLLYGVK